MGICATLKQIDPIANGQSTDSKKKITTSDHVLKGLLEWLCIQLKKPSHPTRTIPALVNCLATLLKEPIVRSSFDNDMVEYVLALIDEILTASPKRAKLFYDKTLADEDIYKPFMRLLWKGSWFIQEKSSKILTLIVSARPKPNGPTSNEQSTDSKKKMTTSDDVLKNWWSGFLKEPSHPTRSIPASLNCLATLLTEPVVRSSFVQADGVKLLVQFVQAIQGDVFTRDNCHCFLDHCGQNKPEINPKSIPDLKLTTHINTL
ncbi:hypothetical protein L1887_00863 [Cichorium endivia]|nr:hypothetical protein L1887_00863 [Cichorium endivia]